MKGHKTYYECHVTMLGDPAVLRPLVLATGWKFSAIDGDPVMGAGVKCYATRLFNSRLTESVVVEMLHNEADTLTAKGVSVTRRKVERVLYDDRSSLVRCDGACPECHTEDLPSFELGV